ncbi:hypothetical protein FA09DRAFT_23218 [Tilletiopsis washingtonensis]|uniref:Uncharacterized protein n=1 Tax=Tilletiopsis washingtonensis TaxID=58919 RepID=A0A316ZAC7_9BASI|nr:hypothetical protein FA09DRAFT_23218 [Tilletiopsis washingtonensis]PWN98256.1 hypothetical protein FA09DRAFT_23218 [Tilletiopsis washingtonensis]
MVGVSSLLCRCTWCSCRASYRPAPAARCGEGAGGPSLLSPPWHRHPTSALDAPRQAPHQQRTAVAIERDAHCCGAMVPVRRRESACLPVVDAANRASERGASMRAECCAVAAPVSGPQATHGQPATRARHPLQHS